MSSSRTWFWAVPAATFLVGLVLGGVLVWVGSPGGTNSATPRASASASPSAAPTASPSVPDTTVTVPGSCVEAAQAAEQVLSLGREAVRQIADLDARGLQKVVDQMQHLDPKLRELARNCQDTAHTAGATP